MADEETSDIRLKKPDRGTAVIGRRLKQRDADTAEKRLKAEVRRRDRQCRYLQAHCRCRTLKLALHVAHLHHKGAGGDLQQIRTTRDSMILVCVRVHGWMHDATVRPVPLTPAGTDGPVLWQDATIEGGVESWETVARERAIGVWEPV